MIEMFELYERILAELEDSGFDNIHSLLNTVINPEGVSGEVETLRDALRVIVDGKLGYFTLDQVSPSVSKRLNETQAAELLANFADWFRYDPTQKYWTLGNGDFLKQPFPCLSLTPQGIAQARDILGRRGYHWWMPHKR